MKTDFNRHFGKHWGRAFTGTFSKILSIVILIALALIIFLANFDYSQFEAELAHASKTHYQERLVQLLSRSNGNPQGISATDIRTKVSGSDVPIMTLMEKTEKRVQNSGILKNLNKQQAPSDLPEIKDLNVGGLEFDKLISAGRKSIPRASFIKKRRLEHAKYETLAVEKLMRDPYNYKIKREHALYINNTQGLFNEPKEHFGYRDQSEIMGVIYSKESLIEACYKKATQDYVMDSGFIKVEFQISPKGYVIGHSIRILDSNLHNRILEQCIKNNIRRWRGFKKLDASHGVARVVHKFIFY